MANGMQVIQEEITFGMLTHLAALGFIVFPLFGNILGPLIVWLVKKDQSAWVDMHGKAALNFQISITIYVLVVGFLSIFLVQFYPCWQMS